MINSDKEEKFDINIIKIKLHIKSVCYLINCQQPILWVPY